MRSLYKTIAYVICALVALQAAMHAWASAGVVNFLAGGGTVDFESGEPPAFTEAIGILLHSMVGMYVIPLLAVLLVVVGFAARFDGAVGRAVIVLAAVAVQVLLGLFGHGITFLALLHGLNALALFLAAYLAARQASRAEVRRDVVERVSVPV